MDQTPKVIIHIGFHKTGTSTLQSLLSDTPDLPFLYPHTGRKEVWSKAHHDLVHESCNDDLLNALRDEIAASHHKVAVISCEDLSQPVNLPQLVRLTESLSQFEVSLTCMLRPHDSYFESLYAEDVKRGRTVELPWTYLTNRMHLWNFQKRISTIEQATGLECALHPYAPQLSAAAYVEMISGFKTNIPDTYRYNQSVPPLVTAAIRELNAANRRDLYAEDVHQLYRTIDEVWSRELRGQLSRYNCILSAEQRALFFEITHEENLQLGVKFQDAQDFWWPLKTSQKRNPVPFENAQSRLLDLILFQERSPDWKAQ